MAEESGIPGAATFRGGSSPLNVNFGDDVDGMQEEDVENDAARVDDEETQAQEDVTAPVADEGKKEEKLKKEPPKEREPGKSLLPFSRVQKILKADRELPMVAREATLLISLAAEEFITRVMEASHRAAQRDRRTTVQHKDLALLVRRAEEYAFLEDIVPLALPPKPPAVKNKSQDEKEKPRPKTLLDKFFKGTDGDVEEPEEARANVVVNEDGTMSIDPQ